MSKKWSQYFLEVEPFFDKIHKMLIPKVINKTISTKKKELYAKGVPTKIDAKTHETPMPKLVPTKIR